MLSRCSDSGIFPEALTAKGIFKFFWYELVVTPELCCFRVVSWEDVWESIQVLVDVLQEDMFGEGTRSFLYRKCWRGWCLVEVMVLYVVVRI